MAVIESGTTTDVAGVGVASGAGLHVTAKHAPVGALGHYRTSHRFVLVATQAANSRLFELRNGSATDLIVILSVRVEWITTAAHTAAILDSLDLYKLTAFTTHSTTNTVTPVASKMRTSFATAGATARGVTVAGAAAGMTGGAQTKDTAPLRQWGQWLLAAVPTGGPNLPVVGEYVPDVASGESPLILVQNEGLVIENRVLLGAAAGSAVSIDIEWAETTAY